MKISDFARPTLPVASAESVQRYQRSAEERREVLSRPQEKLMVINDSTQRGNLLDILI